MKPCHTCGSTLRYKNKRCVPCARRFASRYGVANKERRRVYSKKWYAENHEYARNKNKEWERDNLNQRLAYNHKRRAKKNGAPGSHSAKDIRQLRESCNDACVYCFTPLFGKGHLDHVIPLALGGSDDVGNVQWVCATCNRKKSAKHPFVFFCEIITELYGK